MSKVSPKRRKFQIKKRQKRSAKLKKLRDKYKKAKGKTEKEKILAKVFKIAPWLTKEKFTEPIEEK